MLSLSDHQLKTIMQTAAGIDSDLRGVYLQCIEAMLKLRRRFDDRDCRRRRDRAAWSIGPTPCLERLPGQL
jgi:hypothetical protein